MKRTSSLFAIALLITPVLSMQARWFWERKPKGDLELKGEQAYAEAKSDLKDIKNLAHENRGVARAQDKLEEAKIDLREAQAKAKYAKEKAYQSDTSRRDLSPEEAVEKSKIELDDAKDLERANNAVRRAQDKVAKAKAHLNKSIEEAKYAATKVD